MPLVPLSVDFGRDLAPVFVEQVEAMDAAGAQALVEPRPGRVLTDLVRRILGDRPHRTVACDVAGEPGLRRFLLALAELAAAGVSVEVRPLFGGRPERVDMEALPLVECLATQRRSSPARFAAGCVLVLDLATARPSSCVLASDEPDSAITRRTLRDTPLAAPGWRMNGHLVCTPDGEPVPVDGSPPIESRRNR